MKEWQFEDLWKALWSFKELGVKAVEITGGGDPTCYGKINELIDLCFCQIGKVGIITNGVALDKISRENLNRLTWLRISLNSLDYVDKLDIPKIKGTLGFSYVWTKQANIDDKLSWLVKMKRKHKAAFVRVVPNCLSATDIERFKETMEPLKQWYPELFFQTKNYMKPDRCIFGYFKPFLNSDGYVYHCSAIPLINRKFDERFRLCHWKDIKQAWSKPEWFSTQKCGLCFFKDQNLLLESLLVKVPHEEWI
jgi:MoaA/NifB/PqqE/SkfB family radical SAM enzyme